MTARREDGGALAPSARTDPFWPGPFAAWAFDGLIAVFVYLRAMAVVALIWHLASVWIGNPILLPSPVDAARALVDLCASGEVTANLAASLGRLAISFALAAAIGAPLGVAMGLSPLARDLLDPVIELLRPISGIAWIPLGMFVLGVGEALPTAIMFYGAFFPIVLNAAAGVRSVDRGLVNAARTLGVGNGVILRHVVLPGALPDILVGLRLGAGNGWMAMVAAELIGAPSGLGFAIEWYRELLMTPSVLAFVFLIGLLGYLFDRLLRAIEARMAPWAARERA